MSTPVARPDPQPTRARIGRAWVHALLLCALCVDPVRAAADEPAPDLALEELLEARVQSASRKSQRVQDVAAAVVVLTREDIARAGALTLPEALRLVPGVHVAQQAHNRWDVTARGFAGRFANKLLVLLDGRSIYSPLFGGVIWESESTLLEDIERIEVIRGPGAAMWGANAVNGIINIITRDARDTNGTLLAATAGDVQRQLALRHGWKAGGGDVRLWARATSVAEGGTGVAGLPGNDWQREVRVGARGDWSLGAGQRLTLSAGAYDAPTGDTWLEASVASPTGVRPRLIEQASRGAHLLARHEWRLDGGSEAVLQGYLQSQSIGLGGTVEDSRRTADLDFQHRLTLGNTHELVWGWGARDERDRIRTGGLIGIEPERRSFRLRSLFVQDEWTLVSERLKLLAGLRHESNNYTGGKLLPDLRLSFTPDARSTFWATGSRAVRTPSRAELDTNAKLYVLPASQTLPPVVVGFERLPVRALRDERLRAFELGWRQQLDGGWSVDLTLFENRYDRLRVHVSGEPRFEPLPTPHLVQPLYLVSQGQARVRGAEIAFDWHPEGAWRVQGSWSRLAMRTWSEQSDPALLSALQSFGGGSPAQQAQLRVSYTPLPAVRLDGWLRRVAALPGVPGLTPRVDGCTALDLRAAWRPQPGLELSAAARNLLAGRHLEFIPDYLPSQPQPIGPSWTLRVQWTF